MKTYVLYHQNCPDGCGAALAAYLKFGEEAEYIPVNYGQKPPAIIPGSRVFIVDFSYPRDTLINLRDVHELTVLDHHATAKDDLAGLSYCKFDMAKSGAVMAWEYFHPENPVPQFILYLQDRDLWQWKLTGSREVSAAIGTYPFDFRAWKKWLSKPEELDRLQGEGVICLRLKNQQVEIMAKNHRMAVFDMQTTPQIIFGADAVSEYARRTRCFPAPVSNATVFFSEVGEKLLEMFPDSPFSAYYFDRNDGKRQWGIRSRKEFNAATLIAKPFGGGGHPQACGFTTPL